MTNEVLKKKIMEVIAPFISAYGDDERIADALIEAGIGDVTEYKKTICELNMDVVAYRALSKADTLEQIIEGQKSLINEYEHRAEVAERALLTACVNLIKDEDNVNMDLLAHVVYTKFLRKAEKELSEDEK